MRLSCLTDPAIRLVADASALINLNASGQVRAILAAIPNPLLVTDVVMGELQEDSRSGRRDADLWPDRSMRMIRLVKVESSRLEFSSGWSPDEASIRSMTGRLGQSPMPLKRAQWP